jgi:hypothetical protein
MHAARVKRKKSNVAFIVLVPWFEFYEDILYGSSIS